VNCWLKEGHGFRSTLTTVCIVLWGFMNGATSQPASSDSDVEKAAEVLISYQFENRMPPLPPLLKWQDKIEVYYEQSLPGGTNGENAQSSDQSLGAKARKALGRADASNSLSGVFVSAFGELTEAQGRNGDIVLERGSANLTVTIGGQFFLLKPTTPREMRETFPKALTFSAPCILQVLSTSGKISRAAIDIRESATAPQKEQCLRVLLWRAFGFLGEPDATTRDETSGGNAVEANWQLALDALKLLYGQQLIAGMSKADAISAIAHAPN